MEEGTERIFWIDLILVFNLKIVSVQKFLWYSLETISSEKCIQTFKEFIDSFCWWINLLYLLKHEQACAKQTIESSLRWSSVSKKYM
jgi:hypothetical protein